MKYIERSFCSIFTKKLLGKCLLLTRYDKSKAIVDMPSSNLAKEVAKTMVRRHKVVEVALQIQYILIFVLFFCFSGFLGGFFGERSNVRAITYKGLLKDSNI